MELRGYQAALVAELSAALPVVGSAVLQLPTGGGKTRIASAVIQDYRRRGKRIWFVCHRREIVQQTSRTLEALGIAHGVVAYGHERWTGWQVQVCSVGSLRRAASKLPPPDLIVWDECQHVAAPSWAGIKQAFPAAEHLGLTATPERLDGLGLGDWFGRLICGPTTRDLIEQGHLSGYRFFAPTVPDLSGVGVWAGEYERKGLAEVMTRPSLVGDIVEHYGRLASGARAIAFCVSVAASQALVDRFNEAGIPARHVDSTTTGEARDAAVAALAAGDIHMLSNVEIFTEGFDLPAIDAVILARPTKSLALYRQMVGRGLRTADGKVETIILDHAACVSEHGLPDDRCEWSLEGKATRKGTARGGFLRRCPSCSAVHEFSATCTACGHEYDGGGERTVDQVDGTLIEVGRPDGCETTREFATRLGYHVKTVERLRRQGLPSTPAGLIRVGAAQVWLQLTGGQSAAGRQRSVADGLMSLSAFSRQSGIPRTTLQKYVGRGLPMIDGWVDAPEALTWWSTKDDDASAAA